MWRGPTGHQILWPHVNSFTRRIDSPPLCWRDLMGVIMQDLLSLMAFVGLMAAWLLAVVFVRQDAQPSIETERAAEPKFPYDAQTWSIWISAHA